MAGGKRPVSRPADERGFKAKFGNDDRKGFSPCSRDPLRLTGMRLSSGNVLLMDASRGWFLTCRVYDEEGKAKIHLLLRPDDESRFAYFLRTKPEVSWAKEHESEFTSQNANSAPGFSAVPDPRGTQPKEFLSIESTDKGIASMSADARCEETHWRTRRMQVRDRPQTCKKMKHKNRPLASAQSF
ncbi:MAG: hypothetical protein APF81_08935 [Desulfosporosinus sp. BRH_c37]|nr:MAG: hypothetical protein APF81_08935 [Desulfosporosinus sp. BRH_c37]